MLKIMCQCVCVWTESYHLIVYFVFIIYKVEYMLVKFDHENKKVRLVLCGEEVLQTLQDKGEKVNPKWVAVSCFFFFLFPFLLLWYRTEFCRHGLTFESAVGKTVSHRYWYFQIKLGCRKWKILSTLAGSSRTLYIMTWKKKKGACNSEPTEVAVWVFVLSCSGFVSVRTP